MRKWRTCASFLAVAALTLTVTACGDDDEGGSGGEATGGGGNGGELQLDEPVKIAGAVEVAGESSAAVNSFDFGMRLAIDKINQEGGIGGQEIEYDRVPLSISDGSRATSQFLEAVDMEPTAIMGVPSQVQHGFLKTNIDRAQIPVLSISPAGEPSYFGGDQGSEFLWSVPTYSEGVSRSGVRYLVEDLGAQNVGLMGTNEQYGNSSIEASTAELEELDLEPADVRQHAPNATDLSNDVLAMRDVDAIADWDYPNPLSVILRQLQQNGLDVPVISGESASLVVDNELATGEAVDNLYSAAPCSPATEDTPALAEFRQAYVDAYDAEPNSLAANAHDAVYILKAAVEAAGSADPAAVNEALDGLEVTEGVACAPEYHADGAHVFGHTVSIIDFAADGSKTVATTYEVDDLEAVDS
jgi:branched-chain amino acid transport system substrate-binding protein